MSKTKRYLEDIAMRTAEAVWEEWTAAKQKNPEKWEEIRDRIADEIYADTEELFDLLWYELNEYDSVDDMNKHMPLTYAACKEIAKLIPDHIETMYELDSDLNPIE